MDTLHGYMIRKMAGKRYLMLGLSLLLSLHLYSQRVDIRGIIKDTSGNVLSGVKVSMMGSSKWVYSGRDGVYSIPIEQGGYLFFSKDYYKSQTINTSRRSVINVVMESSTATSAAQAAVNAGVTERAVEAKPVEPGTAKSSGSMLWYFPFDRSELSRGYRTNNTMFEALEKRLEDPNIRSSINRITITSASSPSGSAEYNLQLSFRRAEALQSYFSTRYPDIPKNKFAIQPVGVDWQGFVTLLHRSELHGTRDRLIQIAQKGASNESKISEMNASMDTETMQYLRNEIFPYLQYVSLSIQMYDKTYLVEKNASPLSSLIELTNSVGGKTWVVQDDESPEDAISGTNLSDTACSECLSRKLYTTIRSNLIYDALLLPNLSLDVYLGDGWSASIEGNWSWWTFSKPVEKRAFHRIQSGGVEIRKWFSSYAPLVGHYMGLYGLGGTYDLRLGTKGEYARGWLSNWSWSLGISYGYSKPIARRWNLQFGVAVGYLGGKYHDYDYCSDHKLWRWLGTRNRAYFGITRAEVSLVWLMSQRRLRY